MTHEQEILKIVKLANPANPVAYVREIVKPLARQKLDEYISTCSDCDICCKAKSITKGDVNASIMIIGESVIESQLEQEVIYPFEKTEEKEMLQKLFTHYNVNEDEIFWINTVNCYPFREVNNKCIKRAPSKKEVNNCLTFLNYAIETICPVVIILLGGIALNAFHKQSITSARGKWINVNGIPAMPTYSPSYLLQISKDQDPDIVEMQKIDFCDDIRSVFQYIQDTYPDNNILTKKLEEEY